jgi:hypothetical protein
MPYRYRHQHPILFAKAILIQQKHQDEHCVVAVKGIPEAVMVHFEATLRQEFPQICQVLVTHKTAHRNAAGQPVGRYNLLCKAIDFISLAHALHLHLPSVFSTHLANQNMSVPEGSEHVSVTSYFPGKQLCGAEAEIHEMYCSAWDKAIADFHMEDSLIPKEILQSPNSDISPQSSS